ncbi:MAG: LacI family DNA-binding transcriptional regulator [Blautia sp.]|nr:LacI family DNA-binding transcriptional regulator [Blautia sp.]
MALKAKDIAQMLGVSTATVSLVLNNKPGVGEAKRQEIIEKIQELGCEYMLKDLPGGNGSIGFVVYKTIGSIIDESPFFTYIMERINKNILNSGYTLNFVYLDREMAKEELQAQIRAMNCKGLIIFGVEMTRQDLQAFVDTGIPFVVLDNSMRESDVDSVTINNAQGTSKALHYLYEMGHRRFGYLMSKERITSFEERYQAYVNTLSSLGVERLPEDVCIVEYKDSVIRGQVREFLAARKEPMPTAFFAENDYIACSALQGMKEAGYKIPQDFSIIGFDDRPICTMVNPNMTTICVPKDDFGIQSVNLLLSRINSSRQHSLKVELGTWLLVRGSVRRLEPEEGAAGSGT